MRYVVTLASALLLSVVGLQPVRAQESTAVKTMAGILMVVQHFPTDAQKKTLQDLSAASTTTADEKVVIDAMLHLQHSVPAADKAKLEAITKDEKAPAGVKTLATILGRFLHMANAEDKATLQKLAT
jgi:hypothetical protein